MSGHALLQQIQDEVIGMEGQGHRGKWKLTLLPPPPTPNTMAPCNRNKSQGPGWAKKLPCATRNVETGDVGKLMYPETLKKNSGFGLFSVYKKKVSSRKYSFGITNFVVQCDFS